MDRDSALDQMWPPIPTATHEILGGGGLKLHAREWGNPAGTRPAVHSRLVAERSVLAEPGTR